MILRYKVAAFFLIASMVLTSCVSRQHLVYVNDIDKAKSYGTSTDYEAILQPDDILSIWVSADDPVIAAPYNLQDVSNNSDPKGLKAYLIDKEGYIDFPGIGKVKLGGLKHTEATNNLIMTLSQYIKNPQVNLRIFNFKFSVLGEVNKPGVYDVQGERVTLLEALSSAGDLTLYGKRKNILVIRELDGKKTYNRVDITNSDFLNSPFYYLSQNDVVYVEPNQTRLNSSVIGPDLQILFSSISLIITLSVLLAK